MNVRAAFAVALSATVLLAVVAPAAGVATLERSNGPLDRTGTDRMEDVGTDRVEDAGTERVDDGFAQYKVSLDNVTVEVWKLRNATVLNATVEEVHVRNVTTENGSRTNVTLSNLTVGRFVATNATALNVTAEELVVRNKSVLSVPGGEFIDPNINNQTIDDHTTKNATVSGVVIDNITVDASFLCGNATLGPEADGNTTFDPLTEEDRPDVAVRNGTVGTAVVVEGYATNWSAGSSESGPSSPKTNLPNGCR
jgi:hypothetical protein